MTNTPPVTVTHHALPPRGFLNLEDYVSSGGFTGLGSARSSAAERTIELIEQAGLRGRGGAGFPTGRKWRSLANSIGPADVPFVVVNAAEGEPGTYKDRPILRRNPWLVVEGALIAAHTLGAARIVVATKRHFAAEIAAVRDALFEIEAAGLAGGVAIDIVEGPDEYLFGEETAMLEVIEGEDPLPRNMPPYEYGLFTTSPQLGWSAGEDRSKDGPTVEAANPALVNNVETYAHVALILRHGADWYRSFGTQESPGPSVITITGDVVRPTYAEISLGVPLRDAIEKLAGGSLPGRRLKAVMSGVSNPVLSEADLDAPISYEGLRDAGGGLGSGGFIVFDDSRNMVDVAYQALRFLHVESCGQCNPCKSGTGALATGLEDMIFDATVAEQTLRTMHRHLTTITDGSRCYLPTQAQKLFESIMQKFPEDFEARMIEPGDASIAFGKITSLSEGVVVLDQKHGTKAPDWTYTESQVWLRQR